MLNTDPSARTRLVTSLRELADFLDAHPDVPVPAYGITINVHAESTDNGGRDQVDAVADQLGATVLDNTPSGGHYLASRYFGPITYTVVAIPDAVYARHLAHESYRGSVTPDETVIA
jgi:hypothetical protein